MVVMVVVMIVVVVMEGDRDCGIGGSSGISGGSDGI